jgi:hypothetical protein
MWPVFKLGVKTSFVQSFTPGSPFCGVFSGIENGPLHHVIQQDGKAGGRVLPHTQSEGETDQKGETNEQSFIDRGFRPGLGNRLPGGRNLLGQVEC